MTATVEATNPAAGQSIEKYRVVVQSVGTARPGASAAVAQGLGLPLHRVVSQLYRAPAVLVDNIEQRTAERMASLLCDIGFETVSQSMIAPAPGRAELKDVALYLLAADNYKQVTQRLAEFMGVSEADAAALLLAPPGVILGRVSDATVAALSALLGNSVSIRAAVPEHSSYSLFLSNDAPHLQHRITAELDAAGITRLSDSGLIAVDLDYKQMEAVWTRHGTSGAIRVVNQDFLRFDVLLLKSHNEGPPTPAQLQVLQRLMDVPAGELGAILEYCPIAICESLPEREASAVMEQLAAVGLLAEADLITFQQLRIEVLAWGNRGAVTAALQELGLLRGQAAVNDVPFYLEDALPELQARVVAATLETAGARIALRSAVAP